MRWMFQKLPLVDRVLLTVAIAMTIVVFTDSMFGWLEDTRDPVTIDRVETLNSPVAPGETLMVRVFRDKVRDDCVVQSTRIAVNEDGVPYYLGTATVAGGPKGTKYVDVSYQLEDGLPAGEYVLRVRLTYLCPDGPHIVEQPDARFRVIKE